MKLFNALIFIAIITLPSIVFSQEALVSSFKNNSKTISVECSLDELPSDIVVCQNDQAEIKLKHTDGGLVWYKEDNTHFNPEQNGDLYLTDPLVSSQNIFVQKICPYRPDQLKSLETIWRGDNGKEGVMFSVFLKSDILLQSVDVHMAMDNVKCRVYLIEGSYDMQMNNPSSWDLIYEGMVQGQGKGKLVNIDIPDQRLINGMTYGFYVTLESDDLIYYSSGTHVYEDENLVLENCKGISWPFGSACGSREFNGKLKYAVGERQRSMKYPIEIDVIDKPESPIVYFNGSAFECWHDAEFVWYNNEKPIEGENLPVCRPVESGMYSAAYYTGQCLSEVSSGHYYREYDLQEDLNNVEVYPNPVGDLLNVNLGFEQVSGAEMCISDANGIVRKNVIVGGTSEQQIHVADLSPETYFLSVKVKNQSRTIQIFKQ